MSAAILLRFLLTYWKWFAAAAAIIALVAFYNLHVDGLIKDATTRAVMENNQSWQKAEQAAIARAQADAKAKEEAHQKELDTIQAQRAKEASDAKTKHDHDVAAARAGTLSLRVPTTACASGPDMPNAPGSGNPAAATTELPREITAGLYSIADDADALVADDNSCWQIVASDRKTFNNAKGSP